MADGVVIKISGDDAGFRKTLGDANKVAERALSGVAKTAGTASAALDCVAKSAGGVGTQSASLKHVLDAVSTGAEKARGGSDALYASMVKASEAVLKAQVKADKYADQIEKVSASLRKLEAEQRGLTRFIGEQEQSFDRAVQKVEALEAAQAQAAASYGVGSAGAAAYQKNIDRLNGTLDKMGTSLDKDRAALTQTSAAIQKAKQELADLTSAYTVASEGSDIMREKFVALLNDMESGTEVSASALDDFERSTVKTSKGSTILAETLDDLAGGAFEEVSQKALVAVRGSEAFGDSTVMVSAAARGLQKVIRGLIGGGGGYIALGGAIAYAMYKLYDFTSGAYAARKALEAMNETAEEWKNTQAKTIYDTGNNAFERMSVQESDFKKTVGTTRGWFDRLVETWTDGKKETSEIVSAYVDEFTQGSDSLRDAVKDRQEKLGGLGVDDTKSHEVLEQLDEWDKEVGKLLKKKQNGKLSEKEQTRLDEIDKARIQIEIEYELRENSGYDKIAAAVEADIARIEAEAAANGTTAKIPVELYADALKAGADGYKSQIDALNQSYREQYAAIQTMTDRDEKAAAMKALNEQHQIALNKAQEEYNNLIANYAPEAFQSDEVQKAAADLETINKALAEKKGPEAIKEITDGMAEGKLASYIALLKQLQGGGQGDTDLGGGKTANALLENYEAVGQYLKDNPGLMDGLSKMFGAADEEVNRVMIDLSLTPEGQTIKDWIDEAEKTTSVTVSTTAKIEYNDFSGIEQAAIDNYFAANPGAKPTVTTNVGFQTGWETRLQTAYDRGILTVWGADGTKLKITPELLDTISQSDVWAEGFDENGTPKLEIIVKPKLGTQGAIDLTNTQYEKKPTTLPDWLGDGATKEKVDAIREMADEVERLYGMGEEKEAFNAQMGTGGVLDQLENLNADDIGAITDRVTALMTALAGGELDEQQTADAKVQLGQMLEFVRTANAYLGVGNDIAKGIAGGLTAHGWTTDGETVVSDIETAIRAAAQSNSPAKRFNPVGEDITGGIAEGMEETTSVTAAAEILTSAILAALESASSGARTAGANVGQSFADGMSSKMGTVVAKAVALTLAALNAIDQTAEINSPSKAGRRRGSNVGGSWAMGLSDKIRESQEAGRRLANAGFDGMDAARIHAQARMSSSATRIVMPEPIDYDRLADAVAQRPANLYARGKTIATTLASDNARAVSDRMKRIARGYGGR